MLTPNHVVLLSVLATTVLSGLPDEGVVFSNNTGLPIARIEIDKKHYEGWGSITARTDKIFIVVTPQKHYLKLVFKGGASVVWPEFDFKGVHEIFFERIKNNVQALVE